MTNKPIPIPHHAEVSLSEDPQYMTVYFSWTTDAGPIDRPISQGMSCLPRHVPRLIRAFLEGALFDNPTLAQDINMRWYVAGRCKVYGKVINRDLTRLGY